MSEMNEPAPQSPEQVEAIRTLAHEFNNELCILVSFAELLKDRLNQPNASQYVGHIYNAAQRSSELLRKLLALTCKEIPTAPRLTPTLASEAAPEKPAPQKKLCILAADDEEVLLGMLTELLALSGHDVMKAANGRQAVEIYCAHHAHIDLVILDFKMPIMDGKAAFRAMKQINPSLKAILLSGSVVNSDIETMFSEGLYAFLQKPYSKAQLDELVAGISKK
jgi:CheY-like chemotaxis protein